MMNKQPKEKFMTLTAQQIISIFNNIDKGNWKDNKLITKVNQLIDFDITKNENMFFDTFKKDLELVKMLWEYSFFKSFFIKKIEANHSFDTSICWTFDFEVPKIWHLYNFHLSIDWNKLFNRLDQIDYDIQFEKDNPKLPLSNEGVDENINRLENLKRNKNKAIADFFKRSENETDIVFRGTIMKTEYKDTKDGINTIMTIRVPNYVIINLFERGWDEVADLKVRLEPID